MKISTLERIIKKITILSLIVVSIFSLCFVAWGISYISHNGVRIVKEKVEIPIEKEVIKTEKEYISAMTFSSILSDMGYKNIYVSTYCETKCEKDTDYIYRLSYEDKNGTEFKKSFNDFRDTQKSMMFYLAMLQQEYYK